MNDDYVTKTSNKSVRTVFVDNKIIMGAMLTPHFDCLSGEDVIAVYFLFDE